jgi:L-ascorbate metabolism protein UlaG (beta-lactamase superfamily)
METREKKVKITWFGHAGFKIEAENKIILIDPWLTENPVATIKEADITQADIILVTHDHFDHLGDAIEIAKKTGATLIAVYELHKYIEAQGVKNTVGMNIGATIEVKEVKITMTLALHSCRRGAPAGYIVNLGGVKIYHTGDTCLFGDMKLIGKIYKPSIVLIPIGSLYTMGPEEAAYATKLINPKIVIPMHYGTFPVINQDPEDFKKLVLNKKRKINVIILKPGQTYEYKKN